MSLLGYWPMKVWTIYICKVISESDPSPSE